MRRDSVPGGRVEPSAVAADGWLGGGHGQQQRGLPAGTGIRDQAWHAGEATPPAQQAHLEFQGLLDGLRRGVVTTRYPARPEESAAFLPTPPAFRPRALTPVTACG